MKFIIERTSVHYDEITEENKPCEEAYKGQYTYVDTRTCDCPTKILMYYGDPEKALNDWFGEGSNHRVENGRIKRDLFTEDTWFIDINSLDALINFKEKYGDIIIGKRPSCDDCHSIEIYDYYRE